jgi:hypothetical protein
VLNGPATKPLKRRDDGVDQGARAHSARVLGGVTRPIPE